MSLRPAKTAGIIFWGTDMIFVAGTMTMNPEIIDDFKSDHLNTRIKYFY